MVDYCRVVRSLKNASTISLMAGSPGADTLKGCKDMLLTATSTLLDEDIDLTSTFTYGPDNGDAEFREQLATFLTRQYGDSVDSRSLMVTAGATQALHMVATFLFKSGCVVFMEDPTYFAAYNMLKTDLGLTIVPVPCDSEGLDTEALDRLLTKHRPKDQDWKGQRFWSMVYTIPVYNNPTGRCHSPSRCRRMVELARKHDVLLFAEDVYNLIHFGEDLPPARLLAYDRPSDPEFKGHTLSSGTFSKILAPGLRLGWIEGPEDILNLLYGSYFCWSGGSPNHYASRLAATALKLGQQAEHLNRVRRIYKEKRDAVCKVLRDNLPQGSSFTEPKGGFFVWVEFPQGTDAFEMVKWMSSKHRIFYMPGICGAIKGDFSNCARISFSFLSTDILVKTVTTMCTAAKEYIGTHPSTTPV